MKKTHRPYGQYTKKSKLNGRLTNEITPKEANHPYNDYGKVMVLSGDGIFAAIKIVGKSSCYGIIAVDDV